MREQEMREIKLHGITKTGLKNIIEFIYTSKVVLDMGNLQDTLEAANFLQVMPVLSFCNQLLSSEVSLMHLLFVTSPGLIDERQNLMKNRCLEVNKWNLCLFF